jgi:hypothetical protein
VWLWGGCRSWNGCVVVVDGAGISIGVGVGAE